MISQLPKSAQYLSKHQYFTSAFKSDFKKWQRSHYIDLRYMLAVGMSRLLAFGYYVWWQLELKNE